MWPGDTHQLMCTRVSSNTMRRTRYAPSPTGELHLGGLRTALFNYLFAKQSLHPDSAFVLRIEDTDRTRFVPGAAERLEDTLSALGMPCDESPRVGGIYGSYKQSERLALYHSHADTLMDKGGAYKCFCSAERLERVRMLRLKQGLAPIYDGFCGKLSFSEVTAKERNGESFVVRLKVPRGEETPVDDLIRGHVVFNNSLVDDQVLIKSDGFPTYHLANVVDDHFMHISHVIRGEEWLTSTPKHVLLYRAFGWSIPTFVHLPLLLNKEKQKLSKRHGDTVSVDGFLDRGFDSNALLNYVAGLGWTAKNDREIFLELDELVSAFELERVHKAPAIVDEDKLMWVNQQHIRGRIEKDPEAVLAKLMPSIEERYNLEGVEEKYLLDCVKLTSERAIFLNDIVDKLSPFLEEPQWEGEKAQLFMQSIWRQETIGHMEQIESTLKAIPEEEWARGDLMDILHRLRKSLKLSQKQLFLPLRFILTAESAGPSISDLLTVLGKMVTLRRLKHIIDSSKL